MAAINISSELMRRLLRLRQLCFYLYTNIKRPLLLLFCTSHFLTQVPNYFAITPLHDEFIATLPFFQINTSRVEWKDKLILIWIKSAEISRRFPIFIVLSWFNLRGSECLDTHSPFDFIGTININMWLNIHLRLKIWSANTSARSLAPLLNMMIARRRFPFKLHLWKF